LRIKKLGFEKNMFRKTRFIKKKPVRGFRDLEIYQKTQESAAQVVRLVPEILKDKNYPTEKKVIEMALDIPAQIARAHSQRYEDRPGAMRRMEEILQRCDWMIVHLEQARDIFASDEKDKAALTEIIRRYGTVRVKIRNLHKAWKRWGEENPSGFPGNYSR